MAREYLALLRTQRNESQQDVADALGISRQYYSLIENGDRQKKMDIALISAIATHFGLSMAEIVKYEQELTQLEEENEQER